jgi:hypothetical protein
MAYFLGFSPFFLPKNTFILPSYTRDLHNFYTEITQILHNITQDFKQQKRGVPKHPPNFGLIAKTLLLTLV